MSKAAGMKSNRNMVVRLKTKIALLIGLALLVLGVVGCQDNSSNTGSGPDDSDNQADVTDGGETETADAGIPDAEADVELWPEPWEFHEALGNVANIPEELRPLFVSFDVPPLPEPGPYDWLSYYDEPGQTFDEFVGSRPNLPTDTQNILYVQPLGDSDDFVRPTLAELEVFYEAYFSMEAVILDPIDPDDYDLTERNHPSSGQRQLLTTDILNLLRQQISDDAYSLIAVTMIDLYPDPEWNFVFGQASLVSRVGVFSFARYGSSNPQQTLRRAFKVLAHETGHMFGILHCTHFHCLMNGSNHLEELDAEPIHLCPVDLLKLYWVIEFDPVQRYERLIEVYELFGFSEEAEWLENRLSLSGF